MKAILTKYIPATEKRGSRIKAYDSDGNSVTLPFNSSLIFPHREAAEALVAKMKWGPVILAEGGTNTGSVFVMLCPDTLQIEDCKFNCNLFLVA